MHVSETNLTRGEKPQDHYKEGESLRTRILRIEDAEMKVGLSGQGVEAAAPAAAPEAAAIAAPAAPVEPETVAPPAEPAAPAAEGAAAEPGAKKKRSRKKAEDAGAKT
jgi:hypothetical protein